MDPSWIIAAVALGGTCVGALGWFFRWLWKLASRTSRFMDDYFGEPASVGRKERPGVMTRLENLEAGVSEIHAQVNLDSGHSMKDVVTRTEAAVNELNVKVDALTKGQKP